VITRYVHHDPRTTESPGAGFPSYEDLVAENARLHRVNQALRQRVSNQEEWLRRLNESLEMSAQYHCEWKPIECAPKDRRILGLNKTGNIDMIVWGEFKGVPAWLVSPGRGKRIPTHWAALPDCAALNGEKP